jgi:hypothetical protein
MTKAICPLLFFLKEGVYTMIELPKTIEDARAFIEYRNKHQSNNEVSQKHNIPRRTYDRRVSAAKEILNQKGYDIPENHNVKGFSTLYKHHEDGSKTIAVEWVKTDLVKQKFEDDFNDAILRLDDEITRQKPKDYLGNPNYDLACCYIVTDYHIGQLSDAMEVGTDYNEKIALELIDRWFDSALSQSPESAVGILAELGDFLHADNMDGVTAASGHVLDMSARPVNMVDIGMRAVRLIINKMLEKHEHVHVILAEGNHNEFSSIHFRTAFTLLYEDEPRVTIDNSGLPYYCFEWGDTSLFFHHGHKKNLAGLTEVFASMFREEYGRTKYSYGHCGHLHHAHLKENAMMTIEQHPTLAPKDAYSARGGYGSKRGANVITYHKKYGEVSRLTIRPEMVM